MKEKRPRLGINEQYYFINNPTLQVCSTGDQHFESDDKHYEAGNYFYTRAAAKDIQEKVDEFGTPRRKASKQESADAKNALIKAVTTLALDYREKQRNGKDTDDSATLAKVLNAENTYTNKMLRIRTADGIVEVKIVNAIRNAPKGWTEGFKPQQWRSASWVDAKEGEE